MEIKSSKICVNCFPNAQEDYEITGEQYYGYDFFVEEEKEEELTRFISSVLKHYCIPFESITTEKGYRVKSSEIWSKESIIQTIYLRADDIKRDYLKSTINQGRK